MRSRKMDLSLELPLLEKTVQVEEMVWFSWRINWDGKHNLLRFLHWIIIIIRYKGWICVLYDVEHCYP
jgi:hypothetical protein